MILYITYPANATGAQAAKVIPATARIHTNMLTTNTPIMLSKATMSSFIMLWLDCYTDYGRDSAAVTLLLSESHMNGLQVYETCNYVQWLRIY